MIRITAVAPEGLIEDANQLAMCLAYGPADGHTYSDICGWQDKQGNKYSAASWIASENWLELSQKPLERPEWDSEKQVNLTGATRAQKVLVFTFEPTLATPLTITAIGGMEGPEALKAMGLSPINEGNGNG